MRESEEMLSRFIDYIQPNYSRKWFHTLIADNCQRLYEGNLGCNGLMIFIPPQHGKSEIVSRTLPAWLLGKNPDLKIIGASYSAGLANQFSRSIQRVIDSEEYREIFPKTIINRVNAVDVRGSYVRHVDIFETIGRKGFYKSVGVGGSLTGTAVDFGIIDDPVKDALEAYSLTYRERVWDWYENVFRTRLHNDSKSVLIMTRWHDDDLAGRILKKESAKWKVLTIPAIKEDNSNPSDPRNVGEALWAERHSLERLREIEKISPRTFASLYQQRPTLDGGNIVKRDWIRTITMYDFERLGGLNAPQTFFIDTGYTENTNNDPTGIIAACKIGETLYITHGEKVYYDFPKLLKFVPEYTERHGYKYGSSIRIEPKANGLSVIQQLKFQTGLNVTTTETPRESKEARLNVASSFIECGRVVLVEGDWIGAFIEEICGFPAMPHDEFVDVICYAVNHFLSNNRKQKGVKILN